MSGEFAKTAPSAEGEALLRPTGTALELSTKVESFEVGPEVAARLKGLFFKPKEWEIPCKTAST